MDDDDDCAYTEMKIDKLSFGGCGGLVGRKKGAVGIRINYKGIPMVFISGHLSGIPTRSLICLTVLLQTYSD